MATLPTPHGHAHGGVGSKLESDFTNKPNKLERLSICLAVFYRTNISAHPTYKSLATDRAPRSARQEEEQLERYQLGEPTHNALRGGPVSKQRLVSCKLVKESRGQSYSNHVCLMHSHACFPGQRTYAASSCLGTFFSKSR